MSISKEYIDNEMVYLLLFKGIINNAYFIASRSTDLGDDLVYFNIRILTSTAIRNKRLYNSRNAETESSEFSLRPIVKLNRDVKISELGGTEAMPRTLSK